MLRTQSSTLPHLVLKKRHCLLSCHQVREAIASNMLCFTHIVGEMNPADILSKHWGYQQVCNLLRPVLFWSGDTVSCIDDRSKGSDKTLTNADPADGNVTTKSGPGQSLSKKPQVAHYPDFTVWDVFKPLIGKLLFRHSAEGFLTLGSHAVTGTAHERFARELKDSFVSCFRR